MQKSRATSCCKLQLSFFTRKMSCWLTMDDCAVVKALKYFNTRGDGAMLAWRWWTPTRRVVWMMRSSWFLKIPSISWKVFPVGTLLFTTSFEIRDCAIELIPRKEKNTKSIERFNSIRHRTQAPVSCITLTARSWLNQPESTKNPNRTRSRVEKSQKDLFTI